MATRRRVLLEAAKQGRTDPHVADAVELETRQWYAEYYRKHGDDRNDLLTNPQVLFQTFAFDASNIRALRQIPLDRPRATVLDVGCGSGTSLLSLMRLGFRAANLAGVDINPDRIRFALKELPAIDFRCESATSMSFDSGSFDLVCESTMFVQLTDESLAKDIANEMIRVTARGGFILLCDWRYGKPGNPDYLALSKKRIAELFDVGIATEVVCSERGALVPPLGRALSRWAPSLYFGIQRVLPFSSGQTTTILRKLPIGPASMSL